MLLLFLILVFFISLFFICDYANLRRAWYIALVDM